MERPRFGLPSHAKATLERYPKDAEVADSYEPTNAALEIDSHKFDLWRGVSGGIIIAMVALCVASLLEPGVFGPKAVIDWDFHAFAERIRRAAECAMPPAC